MKNEGLIYINVEENEMNKKYIDILKKYSEEKEQSIYILTKPLGEGDKYEDISNGTLVALIPKHKILFLNVLDFEEEKFLNYVEDFIEDIGSLSDKYNYKKIIGRTRYWEDTLVERIIDKNEIKDVGSLEKYKLSDTEEKRKIELLISLLIGSINDIKRIAGLSPIEILDAIKRRIILFDTDQTKFIYTEVPRKKVIIRGLAGTGKTELLLHKIKELYLKKENYKIVLTCHNKILSENLRARIPDFFDFMKIQEQIKWNEKLWCMSAWGSEKEKNSGVYAYICKNYNIPFFNFSALRSFKIACQKSLEKLNELGDIEPCFDYILIDEGQDFPIEFLNLCEKVVKHKLYIAGDVFQSIFAEEVGLGETDYNLSKCYRTDPRTLMFAHSIGMGLFEEKKISWLSDQGWEACGYIVENIDNIKKLSRKPLKRFDEFEDLIKESVQIIKKTKVEPNDVIGIINIIKKEHINVKPEDIAIIVIDSLSHMAAFVSNLEYQINVKFEWEVNKGHETKMKKENTIMITNHNNIKGLEFPFIICIAEDGITNNIYQRNSLYMSLTRSFLKSYLFISGIDNNEKIDMLKNGLMKINNEGYMEIKEPTKEEIKEITENITKQKEGKSIIEILNELLKEDSKMEENIEEIKAIIEVRKKNGKLDELSEDEIKRELNKIFDLIRG